jgi:hypothetical protein
MIEAFNNKTTPAKGSNLHFCTFNEIFPRPRSAARESLFLVRRESDYVGARRFFWTFAALLALRVCGFPYRGLSEKGDNFCFRRNFLCIFAVQL